MPKISETAITYSKNTSALVFCQHIASLKDNQVYATSTAAWSLFETIWQCCFNKPLPPIKRLPNGKPVFREENGWFFNLSHHRGWVACVLAPKAVGIDICAIQERPFLLAKIQGSKEKNISDLPGLWSRKEAWVKRSGDGLSTNIAAIDTFHPDLHTWRWDDGQKVATLSVCFAGPVTAPPGDWKPILWPPPSGAVPV